ncbi:MAG: hypothetical protein KDA22_08245, partial [Phycisphaerales bacterium]|nr:hypothetical protein [Phycisphaerales bacterium]
AGPLLELIHQASRRPDAQFIEDRSAGYALNLPHLSVMRAFSRLARLEAAVKFADGDVDGAVDAMGAISRMSVHTANDGLAISSLVAASVAMTTDQAVQVALDGAALDPAHAAQLATVLEPLEANDPFRFADSVHGEAEMMSLSVHQALESPEAMTDLLAIVSAPRTPFVLPGEPEPPHPLATMTADEIRADLGKAERLMEGYEAAFREPDPEAARVAIAELDRQLEDGAGGELGKALMPSFSSMLEVKIRTEAMVRTRLEQLRAIANGKVSSESLANAAVWYLKAANAASAIGAERQQYLEAFRLLNGRVEDGTRALVQDAVARAQGPVVEVLFQGAKAPRCAFDQRMTGLARPVAVPPYGAGLRGAVRVLLVSALLDVDGGKDDPARLDRAVASIRTAIAVVNHLSSDPSIAHALLAQSMLEETVAVVPVLLAALPADAPGRSSLRASVDGIRRADPFGHAEGFKADRAAMLARLVPVAPTVGTRRESAIAARDANGFLALALLFADESEVGAYDWSEDRPLVSVADLYDAEACQAIRSERPNFLMSPVMTAVTIEEFAGRDPLGGAALPPIADVTARAAAASAAIGRLDDLLRRAPATE